MSYECPICNNVFTGHHREHVCEGGRIVQPSELREVESRMSEHMLTDKKIAHWASRHIFIGASPAMQQAVNASKEVIKLRAKVAELEAEVLTLNKGNYYVCGKHLLLTPDKRGGCKVCQRDSVIAELEAAQRPAEGLPPWRELVEGAARSAFVSREMAIERLSDKRDSVGQYSAYLFQMLNMQGVDPVSLCYALNRDPETGARVEDGEEVER